MELTEEKKQELLEKRKKWSKMIANSYTGKIVHEGSDEDYGAYVDYVNSCPERKCVEYE